MIKSDFELLLPVGQKEMALAAIHNGADAIYVGFPGFNARGRSYDFELNELKEIIEICHLYGVKVNLAFNIVIFENELTKVIQAIEQVLPLKPDALIVQDLGLVQIVRALAPMQTIHASTQMTITNDLAMNLIDDLKIKRFVLGRENSLSEIRLMAERIQKDNSQKELEVFVHGALCVSYSGQCFTSESLGGRSANRGQCAQSCRFSYDLIVDGEKKNLVDQSYLVSPQDLCGIAEIPELMKIGVKSFKVEGRLKSPEYVASVAQSYRDVMDQVLQRGQLNSDANEVQKRSNSPLNEKDLAVQKQKMAVQYSRGFFSGWLHGVNHQKLVEGSYSAHRGALIGKIISIDLNAIVIETTMTQLENGDGLLWTDHTGQTGGFIFSITPLKKNQHKIGLAREVKLYDSAVNSDLYLNHDKDVKKELQKSFQDRNYFKPIAVSVEIQLQENQPLRATLKDDRFTISDQSDSVLTPAQNKPLSAEMLFDEFSSLSQTPFSLQQCDFKISGDLEQKLFLNHKEIKNLRQRLVHKLEHLRKTHRIDLDRDYQFQTAVESVTAVQSKTVTVNSAPKLNLLLRNKDQVDAISNAITETVLNPKQINSIILDFEFGRDYQKSLEKIKALGITSGLTTTRILKPQEYQNLKIIHSLNPDFILVRNLGALYYYTHTNPFAGQLKGDFSLNVTNHLTANYLLAKGLQSVCLSYDLNFEQTVELLKNIPAQQAEITLHQSMPSFHMEHCVYAAFLSKGTSYKDCGKPCEKHLVQLKDQFGHYHWIKPDQECRNTMYNASSQTALPYLQEWQRQGLGEVRFEALHESGSELIEKIKIYQHVLKQKISVESALEKLKVSEVYGLSPRQLARSEEYQPRKKDHRFL